MLLSATAPPSTRQTLVQTLELRDTQFVIGNLDRPNIMYFSIDRGPTTKQYEHLDFLLKDLSEELCAKEENSL